MQKAVRSILMIFVLLALSGCASHPISVGPGGELELGTKERVRKYIHEKHKQTQGKMTFAEIYAAEPQATDAGDAKNREEYASMLIGCQTVLAGLQASAEKWAWAKIIAATGGAIAGAVGVPLLIAAAPIANRTAIAALGGISGVTNALQSSLTEQGFTSANLLAEREAIRSQLLQALQHYRDAKNNPAPEKRSPAESDAIDEARIACTIYAINTGQPVSGQSK